MIVKFENTNMYRTLLKLESRIGGDAIMIRLENNKLKFKNSFTINGITGSLTKTIDISSWNQDNEYHIIAFRRNKYGKVQRIWINPNLLYIHIIVQIMISIQMISFMPVLLMGI